MAIPKNKIKVKQGENLTDANISKVYNLYVCEKPIPWKDACDILNIAHNKPRLTKIMENFKFEQEEFSRKKKANRGKPASAFEIQTSVEQYLTGEPIAVIAKRIYRSPEFVKSILSNVGVPSRSDGDYWNPDLIPDACVSNSFEVDEVVWSARYNAAGIVTKHLGYSKYCESDVYELYINQPFETPSPYFSNTKGGFFACQAVYDLAKLSHLTQFGIDLKRMANNA